VYEIRHINQFAETLIARNIKVMSDRFNIVCGYVMSSFQRQNNNTNINTATTNTGSVVVVVMMMMMMMIILS